MRPAADQHRAVIDAPLRLVVLEAWTAAVIRWRVVVVFCWMVMIAVGLTCAPRLPALLSTSLAVPGTSSERADAILADHFGENPEGNFTVVLPVSADAALSSRVLNERLVVAARAVPTARVSPLRKGNGIFYGQITTSLDLQRAASFTEPLRQSLKRA